VVGVAVAAVGAEGDDCVRGELPHDVGDSGAQRGPMVLQGPVGVGQHLHALHAKLGGPRHRATGAEHLVVRMSEDTEQPAR
jgi:hypothetical protein